MMIKSMMDVSIQTIHEAFIDAFSGYEVKMDLTVEQLKEMLKTRSYNAYYSRGYFNDEQLVGFILIGYREINGVKHFYDSATGIRKSYQKLGFGDRLLKEIISIMKQEGIERFILEVLENNIAAQELYKKNGFKIKRKLNCFEYRIQNKSTSSINIHLKNNDSECANSERYCSFEPSWQNSNISFRNCNRSIHKIDYYLENKYIGYLIINKENGSIMQLGLENEYRKEEILDEIMKISKTEFGIERVRILNIEDKSEIDSLLKSYGMTNFINQYEMEYCIK